MKRSNVLVLDIETAPIVACVWGLKEQFINLSQVKHDWYIMAWGAKWLGTKEVFYKEARNGDDKAILKPLWNLLNDADIVITQNGKKFDAKKINARLMLHGFPPPKPYKHFDTYQLVKTVADFTSNSLEYLTARFCKTHKKTSHAKYPGMRLWMECMKGNKEAWDEMKKYNIEDVLSTEELYSKIRAWAPDSMPKIFNMTDTEQECGTCGYYGKMKEGRERKAKKYFYRQNSCPKCGAWQLGGKIA